MSGAGALATWPVAVGVEPDLLIGASVGAPPPLTLLAHQTPKA